MQQKQDPLPLFDGWAHMRMDEQPRVQVHLPYKQLHFVEEQSKFPPREYQDPVSPQAIKARTEREFSLHFSKRPGEAIPLYSPTGRPVGNGYFRGYPLLRFTPQEICRVLCLLWRHTAIIRYYELWSAFLLEKFVRGLSGTPRLQTWLEQLTQKEGRREDRIRFQKVPEERWTLADPDHAYTHIRRWPAHAIAAAQSFVRKRSHEQT